MQFRQRRTLHAIGDFVRRDVCRIRILPLVEQHSTWTASTRAQQMFSIPSSTPDADVVFLFFLNIGPQDENRLMNILLKFCVNSIYIKWFSFVCNVLGRRGCFAFTKYGFSTWTLTHFRWGPFRWMLGDSSSASIHSFELCARHQSRYRFIFIEMEKMCRGPTRGSRIRRKHWNFNTFNFQLIRNSVYFFFDFFARIKCQQSVARCGSQSIA